jgi:hypothetical protein
LSFFGGRNHLLRHYKQKITDTARTGNKAGVTKINAKTSGRRFYKKRGKIKNACPAGKRLT